jgi:hypothetical protein
LGQNARPGNDVSDLLRILEEPTKLVDEGHDSLNLCNINGKSNERMLSDVANLEIKVTRHKRRTWLIE